MARFIGGTNILHGTEEAGAVRCGPLLIQCGNQVPRGAVAVSIRPGDIELTAPAGGGPNVFPATVLRHTFLGGQRDYLLELPGGTQLRAVAPSRTQATVGAEIAVCLPPASCRALPQ